ncbi:MULTISPECIES: YihY/virulence factor BrkB family protein [Deferrisoma]
MRRPAPDTRRPSLAERLEAFLWDSAGTGRFASVVRTVLITGWKFRADRGFLRASALTYSTLLSLVPLLALAFSVLKGLGVQRRLEPLILRHLAAGNTEIASRVLEYVERTKVGSLGAVGLVALIVTAVAVIGNVELSLNDIWQVRRGRSPVRKVADYLSMLILGPVLLFASISLTTSLQSPAVLERLQVLGPVLRGGLRLLPFAAVWVAFTALYVILPNRKVPIRSALVGGVVAGTMWQVAEWAYIEFQIGVAKYNAIYGAMAQLPLLFVWLYFSWCIVLWGAELAFVHHLPGRGRYLRSRHELWVPRLEGALAFLVPVAARHLAGEPGPTEGEAVAATGFDPADAGRVLDRLLEEGWLVQTQEDPPRLAPGPCPEHVPVAELLASILRVGEGGDVPQAVRAALEREFGDRTWADLSRREAP